MISTTWGYGVLENKAELRLHNKREAFLEPFEERLSITQIECRDALDVIRSRDRPASFFYCDPPYYNADMAHYGGYTEGHFEALLKCLSECKGRFLLSSYPSDILAKYTEQFGWHTVEIEQRISVSSKGKRKIEVLTANYDIKALLPKE